MYRASDRERLKIQIEAGDVRAAMKKSSPGLRARIRARGQ
jgi:hypothetical protein